MQYVIVSGVHIVPTPDGIVRYEPGGVIDCTPLTAETLLKGKVKAKTVYDAENAANEAHEKAVKQAEDEHIASTKPEHVEEEVASGRHEERTRARKGG